ncbi:MAG: hypothetical protein K2K20_07850 [Lachnospiraceae bacterium]|nr:hypothetical protein [Lachnospiraceae bacterium]
MRKKVWLMGIMACLCVGLTACGNPLKKLPEATGENIYDAEEDTTGNDFTDDLLEDLIDEAGIPGDVTSFVINDRDDNEDSKERTELKVEITTETDTLEYVYYYVADCKYSDGKWVLKDYEIDEDEESLITPLVEVTQDQVKDILVGRVSYYDYTPDDWFDNAYAEFSEDGIVEIKINSQNVESAVIGSGSDPVDNLKITVVWTNGFCNYTGDFELTCTYNLNSESAEWKYQSLTHSSDCTQEMTAETEAALSDEQMTADLAGYPLITDSYNFSTGLVLTEDTMESISFDDIVWNNTSCTRRANIILADQSIFKVHVIADFTYSYNGSEWNLNSIKYSPGYYDGMNDCWASDNDLIGNYSGVVRNNDGTQYATVYYSILTVNADGSLSGVVKWVSSGTDPSTVEPINFTGSYNEKNMFVDIDLENSVNVKYGTGRWDYYSIYDAYLRYNVETGSLVSTNYQVKYVLEKEGAAGASEEVTPEENGEEPSEEDAVE